MRRRRRSRRSTSSSNGDEEDHDEEDNGGEDDDEEEEDNGGNLFYSTQASSDAVVEARFKEIDYSVKIQRVGTYDINELSPQVYNVLCKKVCLLIIF